ncbi:MAG: hypothetical protein K0U78_11245 [Actinomycetia bacterium]|nr:hypothetical protein [Actinomycetes bacterium]
MGVDVQQLSTDVMDYIVALRKEAAELRVQRKEARRERDELRNAHDSVCERLHELEAEITALKAGS